MSANRRGRKRVPISDIIHCACLRTLSNCSGLLADSDVRKAHDDGLLSYRYSPSEPTITRRMRSEETKSALLRMIDVTALAVRESSDRRFVTDATEHNIPNRDPEDVDARENQTVSLKGKVIRKTKTTIPIEEQILQSRKMRKSERERIVGKTVKLHVLVHYETKLAVAAMVSHGKASEGYLLTELLDSARRNHSLGVVAADKGYWSEKNLLYGEEHHIKMLIPPKSNSVADTEGSVLRRHVAKWPTLVEEYGIRENAEAYFSGLKRVYYEDLRSRTFLAQTVEVLAMVLVYNLAVLARRYVEYGADIAWIDKKPRVLLDRAREKVKHLPPADKSPRFHDGITEME
jgi:hypothetical protein